MTLASPTRTRELATTAADELREFVELLLSGDSSERRLQHEAGRSLHDSTLQFLEYLATDAFGNGLTPRQSRAVVIEARSDLRAVSAIIGRRERCSDLLASLEAAASEARRRSSLDVLLTDGPCDGTLEDGPSAALAGATREALTNVRKHAGARRAIVSYRVSDGHGTVVIVDDGVGLPGGPRRARGFGLSQSIDARLQQYGGGSEIVSRPGRGTRLTLAAANAGGGS